jgi:hypothetical protein
MWRRSLQQHGYNEYLVLKTRETRGKPGDRRICLAL